MACLSLFSETVSQVIPDVTVGVAGLKVEMVQKYDSRRRYDD